MVNVRLQEGETSIFASHRHFDFFNCETETSMCHKCELQTNKLITVNKSNWYFKALSFSQPHKKRDSVVYSFVKKSSARCTKTVTKQDCTTCKIQYNVVIPVVFEGPLATPHSISVCPGVNSLQLFTNSQSTLQTSCNFITEHYCYTHVALHVYSHTHLPVVFTSLC